MGDWKSAESIAEEALRITHADRNRANGDPENNFAYIAQTWTALLTAGGYLHEGDKALTAADVARMMIALKLCRDSNAPHRDNRVDAIGYALCLERVESTETVERPHVENPEDEYTISFQLKNVELTFGEKFTAWCPTCKYITGGPTCRGCYVPGDQRNVPTHYAVERTNL